MANGSNEPQGNEPIGQGNEPQGTPVDWQAKYEELKKEARKWEKRAGANKKAAENAEKSAEERIAALESKLEAAENAEAHRKLAAKVASKKGVPADLLYGDTEEEMEEWADKMVAHFKPKAGANVDNPGKFVKGDGNGDESPMREFARQLLGDN